MLPGGDPSLQLPKYLHGDAVSRFPAFVPCNLSLTPFFWMGGWMDGHRLERRNGVDENSDESMLLSF